jgi:hypothetical protein
MPAKRKPAAGKASGAQNDDPKERKVTRTPKGPFQAAKKGEEFFPEEIKAKCLEFGIPKYEVKWRGYDDCPEQNTWEPIGNLVGFEEMVREFEIWWEEEYKRKQQETQIELKRRRELKANKEQEDAIARALLPDAATHCRTPRPFGDRLQRPRAHLSSTRKKTAFFLKEKTQVTGILCFQDMTLLSNRESFCFQPDLK